MKKQDIKLPKGVKITKSVFDQLGGNLEFEVPKGCGLIILTGNRGGGHVPFRALLPHQVYLSDIKKAFEEHDFEVIHVLPVMHESFDIAYNGTYGRQRWEHK